MFLKMPNGIQNSTGSRKLSITKKGEIISLKLYSINLVAFLQIAGFFTC